MFVCFVYQSVPKDGKHLTALPFGHVSSFWWPKLAKTTATNLVTKVWLVPHFGLASAWYIWVKTKHALRVCLYECRCLSSQKIGHDQENWWSLDSSRILAGPAYEAKVQFILQMADFRGAVLAAEIWLTNTLAGHSHTSIKHALNHIKCDASVMYKWYLLMSWCMHTVHNLTPCHAWYI